MVEHKNRHLIETTRTLLLYHKVPRRFWGNAILAACYLINCMLSSSVLHDQIRHSVLLPNQPLFLPPSLCLWLCLFCSYSHSWARQTLSQSHEVSSWVILAFKGVIVVILQTLIATLSLLMSHSLRIPPSSPLQFVLLFRMSYLFLLSYHLQISFFHLQMP